MTPADRVAQLLAIPRRPFDPARFGADALEALAEHAASITGDEAYDIDHWVLDASEGQDVAQLLGHAPQGHVRAECWSAAVALGGLEVTIAATHGATPASDALRGRSGGEVGNAILVARMLDVGVEQALLAGADFIVNDPADSRVRQRYEDMGFRGGVRLDLRDPDALARLAEFLDARYRTAAERFPGFVRPW